ncbi:MAG: wax ester/triacylglycerol synthase family O-acyltransferase [Deltaproteobacteria bacterium]|nr:wax ester/triacylglycerol synthase family O-acyltransferase [Deltaproteobacteria bacterium]
MQAVSGADAYFLCEESSGNHMHTLKLAVVDPAEAAHPVDFELFRDLTMRQLPQFPPFRRRPLEAPFYLGPPVWVEDRDLDVDYHIQHIVLDKPGGDDELDEIMGQVGSVPLRRNHPLWQFYYIEGLKNGHIAYLAKIHHAVADGTVSTALMRLSFQTSPEEATDPPTPEALLKLVKADVPVAPDTFVRFVLGASKKIIQRSPALFARSFRSIAKDVCQIVLRQERPINAFAGPGTRFNREMTAERIFSHATLSMKDLTTVKNAFGCTINDVYLTLVGGALRRYLDAHRELPRRSITAVVPVSIRTEEDNPLFGNVLGQWFASTGSGIVDPGDRIRAVMESTRVSRRAFEAKDRKLSKDWYDLWPLRRLYLFALPKAITSVIKRPAYNVIVSNVKGPRIPMYSDGARLISIRSVGPLAQQQGLNFTAWSYLDDFSITMQACRKDASDLRLLADAFQPELEDLLIAARRVGREEIVS